MFSRAVLASCIFLGFLCLLLSCGSVSFASDSRVKVLHSQLFALSEELRLARSQVLGLEGGDLMLALLSELRILRSSSFSPVPKGSSSVHCGGSGSGIIGRVEGLLDSERIALLSVASTCGIYAGQPLRFMPSGRLGIVVDLRRRCLAVQLLGDELAKLGLEPGVSVCLQ